MTRCLRFNNHIYSATFFLSVMLTKHPMHYDSLNMPFIHAWACHTVKCRNSTASSVHDQHTVSAKYCTGTPPTCCQEISPRQCHSEPHETVSQFRTADQQNSPVTKTTGTDFTEERTYRSVGAVACRSFRQTPGRIILHLSLIHI